MIVVGFAGPIGAGKSAAARALNLRQSFTRHSFADGVREAVAALNPMVRERPQMIRYTEAVDAYGYAGAKKHFPEVRYLLQRFGTEVGRGLMGEDVWVDQLFLRAQGAERVVIDDVRFENECFAIQSRGGIVIYLHDESAVPDDHLSEQFDPFHANMILDNSTKDDELLFGDRICVIVQDLINKSLIAARQPTN